MIKPVPQNFRWWLGAGLALAAAAVAAAQAPDPELMQTRQKFQAQFSQKVEVGYLLYLPPGYEAKAARKWPLILFLHGAGERGTNLAVVAAHGPPKLVKKNPPVPKNETDAARQNREAATRLLAEKFIVVSPQCPPDQSWDPDVLLGLLDIVIATQKVDPGRVYLTGLSMGGFGSWALLGKAPERFAAIAPICGGGNSIDILLPGRGKAAALKSLGVWAFHGAKDPAVAVGESERMVNTIRKAGVKDVQLTVYPEAQHDSWTETYNNPKLYEWFLAHERR